MQKGKQNTTCILCIRTPGEGGPVCRHICPSATKAGTRSSLIVSCWLHAFKIHCLWWGKKRGDGEIIQKDTSTRDLLRPGGPPPTHPGGRGGLGDPLLERRFWGQKTLALRTQKKMAKPRALREAHKSLLPSGSPGGIQRGGGSRPTHPTPQVPTLKPSPPS